MTGGRIPERDRVLDGGFEEPYDGDITAARDATWHHGYEPSEDGGRVYTARRSSAPWPLDLRCPSCGFTRPVCASAACIRSLRYLSEAAT